MTAITLLQTKLPQTHTCKVAERCSENASCSLGRQPPSSTPDHDWTENDPVQPVSGKIYNPNPDQITEGCMEGDRKKTEIELLAEKVDQVIQDLDELKKDLTIRGSLRNSPRLTPEELQRDLYHPGFAKLLEETRRKLGNYPQRSDTLQRLESSSSGDFQESPSDKEERLIVAVENIQKLLERIAANQEGSSF